MKHGQEKTCLSKWTGSALIFHLLHVKSERFHIVWKRPSLRSLARCARSLAALATRFPLIPYKIPNNPREFLTNSALNPLWIYPEIHANSQTNRTISPVIPYEFLANFDGNPEVFQWKFTWILENSDKSWEKTFGNLAGTPRKHNYFHSTFH